MNITEKLLLVITVYNSLFILGLMLMYCKESNVLIIPHRHSMIDSSQYSLQVHVKVEDWNLNYT